MAEELLAPLVAVLISLLAGGLANSPIGKRLISFFVQVDYDEEPSYSDRLSALIKRLEESSAEVDQVLREIGEVANTRQSKVEELEQTLSALSEQEADAKARIDALESVPLEAVEHFAGLVATSDKRSAKRDYMLFASGVFASAIVGLAINLI